MPRFTAQTALAAAQLSVASRKAARERPPEPPPPAPVSLPTEQADTFTTRKLARVREQIDSVEALLDKAVEPQAVDRFANALTRLYDLERILAGRPLPGSRRPKDHEPRREQAGAWAVAEPMVAPAPVVQPALPVAVMVEPAVQPAQPVAQPAALVYMQPAKPAPIASSSMQPAQPDALPDALPGGVTP